MAGLTPSLVGLGLTFFYRISAGPTTSPPAEKKEPVKEKVGIKKNK